MKFVDEFKDFISRENIVDMAVGVVVGSAFTAIVNALVDNVLMPLVGALTVGVLWVNLESTSLTLGLVWASLGGAYLWYLIRRYRKVPLYDGDRAPVSET